MRQNTLIIRREILPELFRHDELQNGIAQKFQALIV